MYLDTFSRRARSLATILIFARVRILGTQCLFVIATVTKVSRKRGLWLVVRVNKKAAAIQILSAQQRLSILFRVIGNSGLADHVDFDLSRIFQAFFDLLGYVSCEKYHIVIADLLRYYHNTYLASCLDRKGLVNSLEGVCDILKLL